MYYLPRQSQKLNVNYQQQNKRFMNKIHLYLNTSQLYIDVLYSMHFYIQYYFMQL